ncbi:glutamate synthase subunit beta [Wolbachia endosymbiont of Cruorifilaria tuberocauda]|uniref:FAD-dependent oxidoreductase n=1 Tax=Wolbachia endosymbiont of Cruorifilaria tuberocauda TaxID=1812111 RepID=UPI00158EE437|nr:FAD-dependent oxidoreductase [Wolbachia endosymbiont of Cruorifilaria tuberocauda]QKX01510.1 glutamate synthase subunit beta [Wolbachia endosymbiont of Cruorifilaria tuberocauda]
MQLNFNISFSDLYTRNGLIRLDRIFLDYIKSCDGNLFSLLVEARKKAASFLVSFKLASANSTELSKCLGLESSKQSISNVQMMMDSQLIVDLSYLLDKFIAKLFNIEKEVEELREECNDFALIYKCKRLFVHRYALKKYADIANIDINYITRELNRFLPLPVTEKKFAKQVIYWLENKENHKSEIELAAQYAAWRVRNKQSVLFSIHKKTYYENLVSFSRKKVDGVEVLYSKEVERRYGFDLTSEKISLSKELDNVHYCIFCHKQNKDSCSKGLINNDKTFQISPLKVELHGCPLEQKISEMNLVKSKGYSIASLAIVMIDNPLCAATGYRICNDCTSSCIYQKQEPVNVPMVETKILDDVLGLAYGFEVYSLLSRWNPLNFQRPLPRKNTGKNILVAGIGPAGFNLAYHLLNDGHNVIAIDGLKIEPLKDNFQPIKDFKHEKLSQRLADGFGGVAEYGITARWNKNYLKVIRLLLERHKNFALYGGVRFGGTVTVDDAFNLGFDHIALALGSGKPRMIDVKNMLVRGVRMASDFLMSLQLTGALRFDSIANLQVRMPIVVIGAGLTAIDTATEALAYYPVQIEKFLLRYEVLVSKYGKNYIEKDWTEEEHGIADEFISHARLIREEYDLAKKENREARVLELMQSLGGVKVVYRRCLKDSPSYRLNSKEVQNALLEGIYFVENLELIEVITDKYNHAESIKLKDIKSGETKYIKARSILIAVGTEPNTVIATEDEKTFRLSNGYFSHLDSSGREVGQIFSPKMQDKDRILVYKQGSKTISFFGDLHPSYRGSVVKAIASVKNGYPIISRLLSEVSSTSAHALELHHQLYECFNIGEISSKKSSTQAVDTEIQKESQERNDKKFFSRIKKQFTARVVKVQYLTDNVIEIVVRAPLAAKNFQPGQFFRLQNFQKNSRKTSLAMEGIAVTGTEVDRKRGIISTIVIEIGGSTSLCKHLQKGEQIVLMGPTGCPTKIY